MEEEEKKCECSVVEYRPSSTAIPPSQTIENARSEVERRETVLRGK